MKSLRRYDVRGVYYFITVVTYNRKKFLTDNIEIFWQSWKNVELYAWVVLQEHFHAIVPVDQISISDIMHSFKIQYYHRLSNKYKEDRVWQNRFWDHIIRDQEDMNRHLDYIHYNPVKHGVANDPFEYEYSSLDLFYKQGYYQRDWGVVEKPEIDGEYGE